jgi:muramidase (phage lysozyme)
MGFQNFISNPMQSVQNFLSNPIQSTTGQAAPAAAAPTLTTIDKTPGLGSVWQNMSNAVSSLSQPFSGAPAVPKTSAAKTTTAKPKKADDTNVDIMKKINPEAREYAKLLRLPSMRAMLTSIAKAEGTQEKEGGYRIGFGFRKMANLLLGHSFLGKTFTPDGESSASGRYQIMGPTMQEFAKKLALPSITPLEQDIVAVALIDRRGALNEIKSGNVTIDTFRKIKKEWASINDGGQGAYKGQATAQGEVGSMMASYQTELAKEKARDNLVPEGYLPGGGVADYAA